MSSSLRLLPASCRSMICMSSCVTRPADSSKQRSRLGRTKAGLRGVSDVYVLHADSVVLASRGRLQAKECR
jgi:hypothetical protein